MKTSTNGIDLIKKWESFQAEAYKCPAGVWTIGYGHTGDVNEGMAVSSGYASKLLINDLKEREKQVEAITHELTQNQFDAIISLVYNIGIGNFKRSTVLKEINKNPRSINVALEWIDWNKADGVFLKGLYNRRKDEIKLFYL